MIVSRRIVKIDEGENQNVSFQMCEEQSVFGYRRIGVVTKVERRIHQFFTIRRARAPKDLRLQLFRSVC